MKITDVKIDGFGIWKNLALGRLSERLTVFFGPNEAGKTTLMQFIRTILYGFSPERRKRYMPPLDGGPAGGLLAADTSQGRFQIRRRAGDEPGPGEVEVVAADGAVHRQPMLDTLLAGVDEPIFNNVFAIGLQELQQLGALDGTEAARQLYELTSGLDRISLVEVMRELDASRNRLLAADDRPSHVAGLMAEHRRLQSEIEELSAQTARWEQLAASKRAADQEIARLEEAVGRMERRARAIELARQLADRWRRREALDEQLAALGPLPEMPAGCTERLDRIKRRIEQRQNRRAEIKKEWRRLRDQAQGLPVNRALWREAARIEALGEQEPWIASIESDVARLAVKTEKLAAALAAEREALGLGKTDDGAALPELSGRRLRALGPPAHAVRGAREQLDQAKRDVETHRKEAGRLREELAAAMAARGEKDLVASLEKSGARVSQLRRRIQIDERLAQLGRHRDELEEQSHGLLQRQVLPVWVLAALGVLFVFGVVLILTGLLGGTFALTSTIGWSLAVLGLGGAGAAVLIKFQLERSAVRRLEACRKQIDLVGIQIEQTTRERDELDRQLPVGGGPLVSRLKAAEADLAALEELLPLDARRLAAEQEAEAADRRAEQATHRLAEARQAWRDALRAAGLPERFSPKQVKRLAARRRQIAQLERRAADGREQLKRRRQELASLADRLRHLAGEAGIEPAGDGPTAQLRRLREQLQRQQQLFERRTALRRQARELRREYAKISRSLQRLAWKRKSLLAEADVADEDRLRQLALKAARGQSLRQERDAVAREIEAAIHGECTEQAVAAELRHDDDEMDRRLEEVMTRWQESDERLKERHERRGRLAEQMKTLAEDRRLGRAQLELACVEKRLEAALRRWQVLAVTSMLLESIRNVYETQRQPETLAKASGYLRRMTDGQYRRVWTPLGENVLRVDAGGGDALPLDVLSRGTREQVFLSLRLALAASYARRGAVLPLVLDDVLVNFDLSRAKATAAVLRDFAKAGHQLLVFTCHEHILKLFKALRVEVRMLPGHDEEPMEADPLADDETPDEADEYEEAADDKYDAEDRDDDEVRIEDDLDEDTGEAQAA